MVKDLHWNKELGARVERIAWEAGIGELLISPPNGIKEKLKVMHNI